MERILEYRIDSADAGRRIEDFLRGLGYSHHVMSHLKRTKYGIMQNGAWTYANQRLAEGDMLKIRICEDEGSKQITPVPMKLDIIYEDEDLMIINKPADMPIHPSVNNHDNTLANGIAAYFAAQKIPYTYRCINRLDRDTSGLLILAKHILSGALLSAMSAQHLIHREYLAVVDGLLPDSGTINAPISRAPDSAIRREVNFEHGEKAVTHYHRIAYQDGCSAALIRLETGRTHQIRVHMSHIGHPLLGDFLYNPGYLERPGCRIRRQALHSCRVVFEHPITHETLSFSAGLPEDIRACIQF